MMRLVGLRSSAIAFWASPNHVNLQGRVLNGAVDHPPKPNRRSEARHPRARRSNGAQGQAEEGAPLRAVQCAAPARRRCPPPPPLRLPTRPAAPPLAPAAHPQKKESSEARKARLDMEALAAAEAEAARQADARRALWERAEREAALTAVNARKLDAEWLHRMRSAKLEELREEARVLSREHDAQVDRRDRLIEVRTAWGSCCVGGC